MKPPSCLFLFLPSSSHCCSCIRVRRVFRARENCVACKSFVIRCFCRQREGEEEVIEAKVASCNMCTCSGNGTQQQAVQDLLCLVDLYLVNLI